MIDPEVAYFHLLSLKAFFPGFQGYDTISMFWGAILAFIYAYAGSLIFHSFHDTYFFAKDIKKKTKESLKIEDYILPAITFIAGILLTLILLGFTTGYSGKQYYKETAGMMKEKGSGMMQMGQMMINGGQMMRQKSQTYNDQDIMQSGEELEQEGELLQNEGSSMMDRGESMMQMMGR